MRLLPVFLLAALVWMSPVCLGVGHAPAFLRAAQPSPEMPLARKAKIVCGDFGEGYTCRREGGAIRRGKMQKIPGARSGEPTGSATDSGDPDALPPASGDAGTSYQAPRAVPATCPASSELLGGHCIPYTQTCRTGLAANAGPQACQGAEEKLVCNFRTDGLKDCCCRTYSKY